MQLTALSLRGPNPLALRQICQQTTARLIPLLQLPTLRDLIELDEVRRWKRAILPIMSKTFF